MVVRQRPARSPQRLNRVSVVIAGASGLFLALSGLWIAQYWITFKGVPLNIIVQFLQDPVARDAYFTEDKQRLHNRLDQMGIEGQIKDFYRSRIPDELELDRYIHQLLYENTGYVGDAYILKQGQLVLKPTLPKEFQQWIRLARRLNLATSYDMENGVLYILTPKGSRVPYRLISSIYTIEDMRQLLTLKKQSKRMSEKS